MICGVGCEDCRHCSVILQLDYFICNQSKKHDGIVCDKFEWDVFPGGWI